MKLIRHKKASKNNYYIVNKQELNLHLFAKVIEELNEVYDAKFEDVEEYADILQVIYDMIEVNGLDVIEVNKARIAKMKKFGNFTKGYLKL